MRYFLRALQIVGVLGVIIIFALSLFRRPDAQVVGADRTVLKVKGLNVGMWPTGIANGAALEGFREQHRDIAIINWSSFRIPGDLNVASELMSFAARSAPDVTFTYIHRLQFYIEQGFFQRLNGFVGEDLNGDGVMDESEVHWKPWLEIPPLFRQMGMRGTDVFALPMGSFFSVMVYRPDLMAAAGLDAHEFPKDFPSFLKAGQKICAISLKNPGSRRIYAMPRELEGFFLMMAFSAGGTPGIGDLIGPDGNVVGQVLPEDDSGAKIRKLGLKSSDVKIRWRAVFDDEPTREALEAIWKVCWQPWILNPHTGEPLDLTEGDLKAGRITCPVTSASIDLRGVAGGVQYGICRPAKVAGSLGESDVDLLKSGELAMMAMQNANVADLGKEMGRYGFALPPALKPGGKPAVTAIPMLFGLNGELRDRKLDAAWKFLSFQCGPEWGRLTAQSLFDQGYPEAVSPLEARRFGFEDRLHQLPENWVRINQEAMQCARVIPYFSGYQQAETEFFSRTVRRISDSPKIDIAHAMRETQTDVDKRILRPLGEGMGPVAMAFAAALLTGSVVATGWGIRSVTRLPKGSKPLTIPGANAPRVPWAFWCLVLPAVISVLVWSYYPIIRGFMLAFQEYRLDGTSRWVGLANFMEGAWSPRFWYTIWNTLKFTLLNTALGFCAPIILAVLLHEIPRGKYFFRTLFFLPSVTSGLVIMLLWMVMYEPTPEGILNQISKPLVYLWNQVAPAVLEMDYPIRWLQNPRLALLCVIIPAVWAAVGSGCLIYLAALQSIAPDLYEAAEIDGAGFRKKLIHVTLPYLRPLLVINLIGVFIGSAQGWGNIFVMTGGGPELSTQVAALEIWSNSFVFLRFGMATAQAWVLGSMLIGFTVWQIKQMQKVEFRKAGAY